MSDDLVAIVCATTRDQVVLVTVAEFLRRRGIPCGAWQVPIPSDISDAQHAFDRELENIIADMFSDVPAELAAMDKASADPQARDL